MIKRNEIKKCCAVGCNMERQNFTYYCNKCHAAILNGERIKNKLWENKTSPNNPM